MNAQKARPEIEAARLFARLSPDNKLKLSFIPLWAQPKKRRPDVKRVKPQKSVFLPSEHRDTLKSAAQNLVPSEAEVIQEPDLASIRERSLVSLTNCKTQKNQLPALPKPKVFTRRGREAVREAGGALEKSGYLPETFVFATLTLPGGSDKACEAFARLTRENLNHLKQWLRDQGLYLTINSWEWQKRGALHLHLIVVVPDQLQRQRLIETIQQKWFDILDKAERKYGVNLYEKKDGTSWHRHSKAVTEHCCKIIQCESRPGSSPVAYLSKYLSKSTVPHKITQFNCKKYYPSSWWSISKEVRKLIAEHTISLGVTLNESIALECFHDISKMFGGIARLSLPLFSPAFAKHNTYQSMYLKIDTLNEYSEYIEALKSIFGEIEQVKPDTGSRIKSLDAAIAYLRAPRNHLVAEKFTESLRAYKPDYDAAIQVIYPLPHEDCKTKYYKTALQAFNFLQKIFNPRIVVEPVTQGWLAQPVY